MTHVSHYKQGVMQTCQCLLGLLAFWARTHELQVGLMVVVFALLAADGVVDRVVDGIPVRVFDAVLFFVFFISISHREDFTRFLLSHCYARCFKQNFALFAHIAGHTSSVLATCAAAFIPPHCSLAAFTPKKSDCETTREGAYDQSVIEI